MEEINQREIIRADIEEKAGEKSRLQDRKWRLALTFVGALIGFGLLALAAPGFYDTLLAIHESLSQPRYSFYILLGSIAFVEFMRATWVESAKARSIRIIPLTSPNAEIWVKEKPLIGIKLPFTDRELKSKKIRPHIVKTELGWIVYPNKSLLSPQWNGEVYFIPADSIHGHGNVVVVSAYKPLRPTRVEVRDGIEIPIYDWIPVDLGNEKYMKAQREIVYLKQKVSLLEEYARYGFELAQKLATEPKEIYAKLKEEGFNDALRLLESVLGKGFLTEQAKAEKEKLKAILETVLERDKI